MFVENRGNLGLLGTGLVLWIAGLLVIALLPAIASVGAVLVLVGKIVLIVGVILLVLGFIRGLF